MGNVETLGAVFNKVGNFSLDTFNDRLIVQKTVYLMQAFDLNIGYHFSWYLRGPYSSGLASDAFELQSKPELLSLQLKFPNNEVEERFNRFLEFMKDKKNDPHVLEILASVHYLKQQNPRMSNEEALKKLHETESKKNIKIEDVNAAIEELKRYNLL